MATLPGPEGLAAGDEARDVALEIQDAEGRVRMVKLHRASRGEPLAEPRPPKIHEIEPGVLYIDMARVDDRDFREALPRLEKAEGIVFDFRGYPGRIGPDAFFPHLINHPVTSAQWNFPFITRPDQTDVTFRREGEWRISPRDPYLKAKRAFVIDGRAISYAESCLGIVEHEKLGALVGGADGRDQRQRQPNHAARRLPLHLDRHEGAQARRLAPSWHRHPADHPGLADDRGRRAWPRRAARESRRGGQTGSPRETRGVTVRLAAGGKSCMKRDRDRTIQGG